MKGFKKISLLLAASMTASCFFALTACTDPEGELKEGKTNITFYARHFEDWSDEFTKKMVNEFNREPENDVYVDLKIYEEDTYNDAIVIAKENGKMPDLFMSSYSSLPQDVREETVMGLNSYFDDEVWDDIYGSVKSFVTFNGEVYGFPWFSEPGSLFFYRKDVLQAVGYNAAPKTFEELYDVCGKIQGNLKIGQYALGLPATPSDLAWSTWGLQYNLTDGLAVTDDWLTSRIEHEGYKELCRFFYTCGKNKYSNVSSITADGYSNLVEALFDGNVMMSWGGSWQIALMHTLADESGDDSMLQKIGVAPLPTLSGDINKTTSANGGWCYTVSDSSALVKKQAAVKFIQWLFVDHPEKIGEYFIDAYMCRQPASQRVSEYLSTVDTGVDREWIAVMEQVSSLAKSEALYPWDISYEVSNMLQACMQSESTSFESVYRTAISSAKTNIQTIMSRASYTGNPWYNKDGE